MSVADSQSGFELGRDGYPAVWQAWKIDCRAKLRECAPSLALRQQEFENGFLFLNDVRYEVHHRVSTLKYRRSVPSESVTDA